MKLTHILFLFIVPFIAQSQSIDSVKLVLGKVAYAKHEAFQQIPETHANRAGMYLRKDTFEAFAAMKKEAQKDGVSLTIISAARSFNHQKRIWEAKWTGSRRVGGKNLAEAIPNPKNRALEILKYSSMPGTSRHHWGTDIDINSLTPFYFESGKGQKEYEWLRDNAYDFGFCQVYSEKGEDRKNGYEEEKWHWSYVPAARLLTKFHASYITAEHLQGFEGSNALSLEEKARYIQGIAKECK
jgi:D-alanyl-D-alanine carboxypeptidase